MLKGTETFILYYLSFPLKYCKLRSAGFRKYLIDKESPYLKDINFPEEMIFKILSFIRIVEMKENFTKEFSFAHSERSDKLTVGH